jgi:hypothetical protein
VKRAAGREVLVPALALLLTIWYGALLAAPVGSVSARTNERVEATERFGSEAIEKWNATRLPDSSLQLDALKASRSSAGWRVDTYELRHVAARARSCRLTFYAAGLQVAGRAGRGSILVELNGAGVRRIHFSSRDRGLYPVTPGLAVPDNFDVRELRLAPLDRIFAAELPLDARLCRVPTWHLRITARHARWNIERIGVIATFVPERTPISGSVLVDSALAILEILSLAAATAGLLWAVDHRLGGACLLASVTLLLLSPLTHDQWDFAVWLRFTDLAAFGHANPAGMWGGTPLWAFIPAALAPCLTAAYALFDNGSQDIAAVVLKGTMGLAYVTTALLAALLYPQRWRRTAFFVVLGAPIALYQLAGGYREVFAGALFATGIHQTIKQRFTLATVLLCAAASITESLLPFILFAPALASAQRSAGKRRLINGLALAALAIALVAGQWLFLIPHEFASYGLASRVNSYRFGGGSWYSALDDLGILREWLRSQSLIASFILFVAFATLPVLRIIRGLRSRDDAGTSHRIQLEAFVMLTAAFFLSFRGIDPNTWYAIFVVTAVYFGLSDPASPFPLLLGAVQGCALYATLGLGDFVNWTYLWPHDRGLLGILGKPMDVFVLMSNGLILSLYLTLAARKPNVLFGPISPTFLLLFFAAAANAGIRAYPEDTVFCCAAAFLVYSVFARLHRIDNRRVTPGTNIWGYRAGLGLCIAFGALFGGNGGAPALAASLGTIFAIVGGIGIADVTLALGASGIEAVSTGFGWFSILGWIALSLLALKAVYEAARGDERPRPTLNVL